MIRICYSRRDDFCDEFEDKAKAAQHLIKLHKTNSVEIDPDTIYEFFQADYVDHMNTDYSFGVSDWVELLEQIYG